MTMIIEGNMFDFELWKDALYKSVYLECFDKNDWYNEIFFFV